MSARGLALGIVRGCRKRNYPQQNGASDQTSDQGRYERNAYERLRPGEMMRQRIPPHRVRQRHGYDMRDDPKRSGAGLPAKRQKLNGGQYAQE